MYSFYSVYCIYLTTSNYRQNSENIRLDEINNQIIFNDLNFDQIELMDMNSKLY